MTEILIIRHGQTPWNVKRWVQGWTDIELNEHGQAQAAELAAFLASNQEDSALAIDALYSSDLKRAVQTAEQLGQALKMDVALHSGVRERRYGMLEGLPFDELKTRAPREAKIWHDRDPDAVIEGAETLREFQTRIVHALNELARKHPSERLAVVTHGGAMDIIWRQASGVALENPQRAILLNASINRIQIDPNTSEWSLIEWGNIDHLKTSSHNDIRA
ncbi:histidine phosphatase family protein [Orrella sp. 11846]|uniref:histidine phosphatase family protein n=1 Tax=Orrella sp. 11846 TaxID=3409913 RepID=UPI003B58BA4D